MRVALAEVPIEIRAEAAWRRAVAGDDPFLALHAVIWPEAIVPFDAEPEMIDGYCVRGHAFTDENTYRRPNGGRNCRTCIRTFHKKRRWQEKQRRKVPCSSCGAPATSPRDGGRGRCRACYLASKSMGGA